MAADEKLWRYSGLARLWSWCLIGVALVLLPVGAAFQAGAREGLGGAWIATTLIATGATGLVLYPLFRVWFQTAALPSARLPRAERVSGRRRLEASPSDWRRWALTMGAVLLVGGAAMMLFLVGVLGRGGIAEGVVVGMMAAWGLATLGDARRIEQIEREQGRDYFAACRRPVNIGDSVVWVPRAR